jgi:glycosyltransferase involved in cell wall biosynthesis
MSHIVHVVESFGAGVLSIVADIANHQMRDGHQVSLIYALRDETPKNWRELFDPRIESYFLSMVRAIHPIRDLQSGWQLLGLLKRLKPNVVHLHSSKAGAIGRLVSLFYRRARYFFSPHGLSFLPNGGSVLKQAVFLWLEKGLALCPTTVIACSASEAEEIRRHLTERVFIIENAVDPTEIPVKTGLNPRLRIGSVGRICPQKHPEAFAAIAKECKDLPLDFIWIGAGDAKGEALLRAAGVVVTGWMSRADVLKTLSQWDVYLQTSRWEGMPVAVIEAMLAGLPAVVSNVTGNRDVVVHGETGLIANHPQGFVQALTTLTEAPESILTLGKAAREAALSRFSISHMIHTLYQVYGL